MSIVHASRSHFFAATAGLLSCLLPLQSTAQSDKPKPKPLYTQATIDRAQKLLAQMTLDEKIGQMIQLFVFDQSVKLNDDSKSSAHNEIDDRVSAGKMGSALFMTDPVAINRIQKLAVENTRLHIPLIFGYDVIHGFRTGFPVPIAMAASWDPATAERSEAAAAEEASSVGINWAFAPMIDIARDARWGRMVEGAGEDPYLGSAMARAEVKGFQGPELGTPGHLVACAKHFAGYGAAEGGRDYDASYISEAQLHNVYLPPFQAAVDAGVGTLMSAYMDLNDVPATGNKFLLTDTLRTDWGFEGFVVSDADAVKSLIKHGFAADPADAADRAANAGINMEMALGSPAYDSLKAAVDKGQVSVQQLDAAVLPILETKIQIGLFEHPYADAANADKVLHDPAHRRLSQEAAEKSAVLLRNQGGMLPLSKSAYKSIAVIGPTGSDPRDMTGPWIFQQDNKETVTIPEGLRKLLGPGVSVEQADGVEIRRFYPSFFDAIDRTKRADPWTPERSQKEFQHAVDVARGADLVVLTMGEHLDMSGEAASDSSIELPGDQMKLMQAVAALGKPTVLVLTNGRPLNIAWANEHVNAILETWHPGTEGGPAIAGLLFGDAIPGGHLPFSWPRNVGQIPINYGHNMTQDTGKQGQRYWSEPSTPLFPFGYGLSYSTFKYSNIAVANATSALGSPVNVTVDVENTGSRAADDVAQLYIHQRYGRSSRPVRELKGFQRVHLEPGQKQTVSFTLTPRDLAYWSATDKRRAEDASPFDVWAGDDSTAELHSTFTRTAQ